MNSPLAVEGLAFKWPNGHEVLSGMSFALRPASVTALVAGNGAGKTTLLKLLAGLLVPTRGSVYVRGVLAHRARPRDLYRHLGLLLQDPDDQLLAPMVSDDCAQGVANLGFDSATVADRVAQSLAAVGAGHLAQRNTAHLSAGEKRRVALAGVLAMGASVLLLDEPTASLDPKGEQELLALLGCLRDGGKTLLVATHAVDWAVRLADRILLLLDGSLAYDGPTRDLFVHQSLIERANLRPPLLIELGRRLRAEGLIKRGDFLTVEEACRELRAELAPGNQ